MSILAPGTQCHPGFPSYFSSISFFVTLPIHPSLNTFPFPFYILLYVGFSRSDVVVIEFGVQGVHCEPTPGERKQGCEKEVEFDTVPTKLWPMWE